MNTLPSYSFAASVGVILISAISKGQTRNGKKRLGRKDEMRAKTRMMKTMMACDVQIPEEGL